MERNKFSKDEKVKLISQDEYFRITDYLNDFELHIFNGNDKPSGIGPSWGKYYKITHKYLIVFCVNRSYSNNFREMPKDTLEYICMALRDGKTEYKKINNKLDNLLKEKKIHKRRVTLDRKIENTKKVKEYLEKIPYELIESNKKPFKKYIKSVRKTKVSTEFYNKYVVLDVETNGTRKVKDDLLSISIYDPTIGKCYNRLLPLDLQPLVLTGWINGITENDLKNATHLTQEEVDEIIKYFDLKNKIILSFSGGKGNFDSDFINYYFKRHKLIGFEDLKYENIKSLLSNPGYGYERQMTKDNLCRLLKIEDVQDTHSGLNDCVLEWKLFSKLKKGKYFFIDGGMFEYKEGYIVPVTYLNKHSELVKYANITVPSITGKAKCVFSYSLPETIVNKIKKFPTNITGITIEHRINTELNVEKKDNKKILVNNKKHISFIGALKSNMIELPYMLLPDGSVGLPRNYQFLEDETNDVSELLAKSISNVIDYIKKDIFKNTKILSQELVISNDSKVLALCDLSNEENILEIKTYSVCDKNMNIDESLARQLYYQSDGRNIYVLSINIIEGTKELTENVIEWARTKTKAVDINIYKIEINVS